MKVKLWKTVLSLCLVIPLLLACINVSIFRKSKETCQEQNSNPMPCSVPDPKCPEQRSGYCIFSNYQPAQAIVGYDDSITLTTQGTLDYLTHLIEVCERWQGPISVSVYAPGRDFLLAKQIIESMRSQRDCVRRWTSWHLIFDLVHPPTTQEMLDLVTSNGVRKVNSTYKHIQNLAYPINVARNVARRNAKTRYIFASDIELYPSKDVIPKFLDLVRRMKSEELGAFSDKRQVFVLPVFEVTESSKVPHTKSQLLELFQKKQTIPFHMFRCQHCHRIPQLRKWLFNNITDSEMIYIFLTIKRDRKHSTENWEPFFIGTNKEPFFDERLIWYGKNKMQVVFEMCLLDYDFHVLDGAFLTHAPGIKGPNLFEPEKLHPSMDQNSKTFKIILQELRAKYGDKDVC